MLDRRLAGEQTGSIAAIRVSFPFFCFLHESHTGRSLSDKP